MSAQHKHPDREFSLFMWVFCNSDKLEKIRALCLCICCTRTNADITHVFGHLGSWSLFQLLWQHLCLVNWCALCSKNRCITAPYYDHLLTCFFHSTDNNWCNCFSTAALRGKAKKTTQYVPVCSNVQKSKNTSHWICSSSWATIAWSYDFSFLFNNNFNCSLSVSLS